MPKQMVPMHSHCRRGPRIEDANGRCMAGHHASFAAQSLDGFAEPGKEFVRLIAHLTPREQRLAIERAFASAVANDRSWLKLTDFPTELLLEDNAAAGANAGTGYLH